MENFNNDLLKIFFLKPSLDSLQDKLQFPVWNSWDWSKLNIQAEVEKNQQMRGHTTICHVKAGADKHLNNFHTSQSYIFMSSSTSSSCFKDYHQSYEECLMKTLMAMIIRKKKQMIMLLKALTVIGFWWWWKHTWNKRSNQIKVSRLCICFIWRRMLVNVQVWESEGCGR